MAKIPRNELCQICHQKRKHCSCSETLRWTLLWALFFAIVIAFWVSRVQG